MKNAVNEQLSGQMKEVAEQIISLSDKNNEKCAKSRGDCIWEVQK